MFLIHVLSIGIGCGDPAVMGGGSDEETEGTVSILPDGTDTVTDDTEAEEDTDPSDPDVPVEESDADTDADSDADADADSDTDTDSDTDADTEPATDTGCAPVEDTDATVEGDTAEPAEDTGAVDTDLTDELEDNTPELDTADVLEDTGSLADTASEESCEPSVSIDTISSTSFEIEVGDEVEIQVLVTADSACDIDLHGMFLFVMDDEGYGWMSGIDDDAFVSASLYDDTNGEAFDDIAPDAFTGSYTLQYSWCSDESDSSAGDCSSTWGDARVIPAGESLEFTLVFSPGSYLEEGAEFDIAVEPMFADDSGGYWVAGYSSSDLVSVTVAEIDADGDGYGESDDCDDADATVNPGESEILDDGIDQDCDGDDATLASLQDEAECEDGADACFVDVDGDEVYETLLMVGDAWTVSSRYDQDAQGYETGSSCGLNDDTFSVNDAGYSVVSFSEIGSDCSTWFTLTQASDAYWWQNLNLCYTSGDPDGMCVSTGSWSWLIDVEWDSELGLIF